MCVYVYLALCVCVCVCEHVYLFCVFCLNVYMYVYVFVYMNFVGLCIIMFLCYVSCGVMHVYHIIFSISYHIKVKLVSIVMIMLNGTLH